MYSPNLIKGLEKGEDLFCWHCRTSYEMGKDSKGRIVRVN